MGSVVGAFGALSGLAHLLIAPLVGGLWGGIGGLIGGAGTRRSKSMSRMRGHFPILSRNAPMSRSIWA